MVVLEKTPAGTLAVVKLLDLMAMMTRLEETEQELRKLKAERSGMTAGDSR